WWRHRIELLIQVWHRLIKQLILNSSNSTLSSWGGRVSGLLHGDQSILYISSFLVSKLIFTNSCVHSYIYALNVVIELVPINHKPIRVFWVRESIRFDR